MTEPARRPQTPAMDGSFNALPDDAVTRGAPVRPVFEDVYRGQFEYVWRSLRRLGVREADLPDTAHDVFVVVHRKLADYDAHRPLKPWLFGICFRTALDKKRKASSWRESLTDDVRASSTLPASDDLVAAREAHDQVQRALDTLSEDKRAVFVMHELEGLSMPEIAELVEAPLNTCYSRLRLAREAFVAAVRAQAAKKGGAR